MCIGDAVMSEDSEVFAQMLTDQLLSVGKVDSLRDIAKSIDEQTAKKSIGRKCVEVDEMAQGQAARYDRERNMPATVWTDTRGVCQIIEGDEFLVPYFRIATSCALKRQELKAKRYYLFDRLIHIASKDLARQENEAVLLTLKEAAAENGNIIRVGKHKSFCDGILDGFASIERHDHSAAHIVVSAGTFYEYIREDARFNIATQREILEEGFIGTLATARVHTSKSVIDGQAIISGNKCQIGKMPIHNAVEQESVVAKDGKIEIEFAEYIGVVVLNSHLVAVVHQW
jgi:hypothetical protein